MTLLAIHALGWVAPGSADAAQTEIMDFGYSPDELGVAVGDEVTWVNTGAQVHTVVADTDASDSFGSAPIEPGERFTHTFKSPGTFSYHCELHRSMKGVVRVAQRSTTSPKSPPAPSRKESVAPSTTTTTTARPATSTTQSFPSAGSPAVTTQPTPASPSPPPLVVAQPGGPATPPTTAPALPAPAPPTSSTWAPAGPTPDDSLLLEPKGDSSPTTTGMGSDSETDAAAEGPSDNRSPQPWRGWADLPMAALGAALIAGGAGWLVKIRLDQRR